MDEEDLEPLDDDLEPVESPQPTRAPISIAATIDRAIGTIPGVKQVGAGLNTAIDVVGHPGANIADTYNAWRAHQDNRATEAQQDNPWTYGLGSAAANLAAAAATGPALAATKAAGSAGSFISRLLAEPTQRAANVATQGAVTLADAAASAADEGDIKDAGAIALGGKLVGDALSGVASGVVKKGGALLKGVQNTTDDVAAWLGDSRIGKLLASEGGSPSKPALRSERVRELEQAIADVRDYNPKPSVDEASVPKEDTLSLRLAKAAREGRARIGDSNKSWDPREFGDDFANMSHEAKIEALERYYPEKKPRKYADFEFTEIADSRVDKLKKAIETNQRVLDGAPETDAEKAMYAEMWREAGPLPKERELTESSMNNPWRTREQQRWYEPTLNDADRNASRIANIDVDAASMRNREGLRSKGPEPYGPVADRYRGDIEALKRDLAESTASRDAAARRARSNLKAETDRTFDMARGFAEALEQDAAKASEKARLQSAAGAATKRKGDIDTGRSVIENGAGVASAVGGGSHGVLGLLTGIAAAKPIGKGVLKGIDMAGALGQKLAGVASIAERLAARDDAVGRAAKWALSAEGENALVRMAALADMPEVQEEFQR